MSAPTDASVTSDAPASVPGRERLFEAALQAAGEAVALVEGGRLVFANRALLQLVGVDSLHDGPTPLDSIVAALTAEACATGRSLHGRFAIAHPDGERYLDLSLLPLDVPDRQSQVIFARTAPAESEGADRGGSGSRLMSLGRITASVAHDINNPLAYLLGSIELAERDLQRRALISSGTHPPSGILEAISNAREGVERLRSIVRDLMAFSRPVAESKSLVDIESLLDSTIKLAWNEIRHRARLVKRYGRVACVLGDESRLGQVFLNLLVNAVQSVEASGVSDAEIVVSTRSDVDGVIVEIADTGRGIDEHDLPHVFEPFFTNRPGIGTGLGLSICRDIVASHGGDISVESGLGHGAVFRVRLPAARGTPPPPPPAAEPDAEAAVERARILVIDDEPLLGQTLGFAFSGRHDVVVTSSGREALALLTRDSRFDLVLCDLMMPDVSGQKVFQTVEREHPALVQNFVFMTGGAFTDSAQSFLESHPGRRIEKPFTIAEIERLLIRAPAS
jgi:signal transduction histidine kinase